VVYDDLSGVLISCGEDALVKGWDLTPLWRGAPNADDMEPYITLRGHTAPVLALAYRSQDRFLFSAGMDYGIRAWRLPNAHEYNAYASSSTSQHCAVRAGLLVGHSDSVWSLQQHPHLPYLVSASADGSMGLWAAAVESFSRETCEMEASFSLPLPQGVQGSSDLDVPTCVAWVPTDVCHFTGGYMSSRISVFDVKRGAQVLNLMPNVTSINGSTAQATVTSICCHNTMQLAAVGHTDNCARLVDLQSGQYVATVSDHGDVVTSVSVDPGKGYCLVTGCHDGCVRSFDLRTGRCCERLKLHRAKYDEAIHCVHHASRVLSTAGADGNVVALMSSK